MASRNPNDLRPDVFELYQTFSRKMKDNGLDFMLTCVARKAIEQKALYAQGREPLEVVNKLMNEAGLSSITEQQNKRKVTWTMHSKHIVDDNNPKSRAFDIAILKAGKIVWDTSADTNQDHIPDYKEAGQIWESISIKCKWGGSFGDQPHFEVL